jgi:hypothetical protein
MLLALFARSAQKCARALAETPCGGGAAECALECAPESLPLWSDPGSWWSKLVATSGASCDACLVKKRDGLWCRALITEPRRAAGSCVQVDRGTLSNRMFLPHAGHCGQSAATDWILENLSLIVGFVRVRREDDGDNEDEEEEGRDEERKLWRRSVSLHKVLQERVCLVVAQMAA